MSRASEPEVRKIISTDTTLDLSPFIDAASGLVDRVKACDTEGLLSSDQLRRIETWLAAHFYALRDQVYQSKSTQSASATFQGQSGLGLDGTQYGQMAKTLDFTGCLAEIDRDSRKGKINVEMTWLGKPPSTQIDYEDRD